MHSAYELDRACSAAGIEGFVHRWVPEDLDVADEVRTLLKLAEQAKSLGLSVGAYHRMGVDMMHGMSRQAAMEKAQRLQRQEEEEEQQMAAREQQQPRRLLRRRQPLRRSP